MVAITDIPFVVPLAEWIWAADKSEDVSPEICLSQVPIISSGCFSQLLTKALGMAIILGSCLNKMPIMINMMNNKSAAGISRNSLYGEAIVYACGVFYGFLEGHPFTAYGENISLLIQNAVLVLMAWQFSTSPVKIQEKGMVVAGFACYIILVLNFLPESSRYLLMSATWPVMLYARGSQVLETSGVKHTGNLSIVTTSMNLVGALIRIGTTLKETGDTVVLSGYLLSLALSLAMFVQYWMYLENTQKVAKETKEANAKKDE
jgi:mannose-P-dolichol utilization defect protein 1